MQRCIATNGHFVAAAGARRQSPVHQRRRRPAFALRASADDEEAQLEAMERRAGKKGKGTAPEPPSAPAAAPSMKPSQWSEGELLPGNWDRMSPTEKVRELYMGERGLLFWMNKAATASLFIVAGAWVLFRFIGPALGLYELQDSVVR